MKLKITNANLYWLAGYLEGEGSFLKSPPCKKNRVGISVETTDKDVAERVSSLFKVKAASYSPRKEGWKPTFKVLIIGMRAVLFMEKLFPLMGDRRKTQITAAINDFKPDLTHWRYNKKKIPSVELLKSMHKTMSYRVMAKKIGCHHSRIQRILSRAT